MEHPSIPLRIAQQLRLDDWKAIAESCGMRIVHVVHDNPPSEEGGELLSVKLADAARNKFSLFFTEEKTDAWRWGDLELDQELRGRLLDAIGDCLAAPDANEQDFWARMRFIIARIELKGDNHG